MGTFSTSRRLIAVPILIAALAACGGDDEEAQGGAPEQTADLVAEESGDAAIAIGDTDAAEGGSPIDLGVIGRDVAIEMHVVLGSADIERSVASISASASAAGGGIASSDINYGSPAAPGDAFAVLVVKVPPEAIDNLLDGLAATGTVQSINQRADDVTEQLVDLEVRIANARQSVDNVRQFMERTENLTELVTLEGELTRRQTELEQLEAQQRNLADRVALSTITIEVVPLESLPEVETDPGIGDAISDGWNAFVAVLFGIVYVLAVLAPFLIVGGLVALVVLRVVSRRRSRPAPTLPPPAAEVTAAESVSANHPE